ncbi:MAG: hypothetical protein ACKO9Z_17575 [Planctomycetota bacterium]
MFSRMLSVPLCLALMGCGGDPPPPGNLPAAPPPENSKADANALPRGGRQQPGGVMKGPPVRGQAAPQ